MISAELLNFNPFNPGKFEEKARELYSLQILANPILTRFACLAHLPDAEYDFFSIEIFKDIPLNIHPEKAVMTFESSGTSGRGSAFHSVSEISIYDQALLQGFDYFYPDVLKSNPRILALLPSYLERGNSSLVYMVHKWIQNFGALGSGFYLNNFDEFRNSILESIASGERLLIIGVTYALLDFFEAFPIYLPENTILMETGGMKGRKLEMTRNQVHRVLKESTGLSKIQSEYGMTELLSQAYSAGDGHFFCPPWMNVEIREINDVSTPVSEGKSGRICIIDLANKWTCAFIATGDMGRKNADGSFEVLGRADTSGLRGCSLLYSA